MDYLFRWLGNKFLPVRPPEQLRVNGGGRAGGGGAAAPAVTNTNGTWVQESDAPACHECGTIMVRSGACYKCSNCGSTSGCS